MEKVKKVSHFIGWLALPCLLNTLFVVACCAFWYDLFTLIQSGVNIIFIVFYSAFTVGLSIAVLYIIYIKIMDFLDYQWKEFSAFYDSKKTENEQD